ncbi:MAG: type II toxin-antitoxin system ParD family antitoxin [Acidobacteriota bacterium]|nr:type II toxin-antitoxin system ParD family antitoxin [Acidobacteriota bacterium]
MDISLTPELEELVNQKVASGMYNSASEVVREGLRLLKEYDELERLRVENLRREIMVGVEQARRGQVVPLDVEAIKAEGRQRLARTGKCLPERCCAG